MEPIHVPGPPKQAFNKNRPISDLIRAQVNHLKHVEASLSADQRSKIPQHAITTEDDAAQYIASMTNLFQAKPAAPLVPAQPATPTAPVTPMPKPAVPVSTSPGLAIAASADAPPKKTKQKTDKQKKEKSPGKDKKRKKK